MVSQTDKIKSEIIEDIYDIIFNTRFKQEAKNRFFKHWKNKELSVEYTENQPKVINIGRKYTLTLTTN